MERPDSFEQSEIDAAEAEAGQIGGVSGDEDVPERDRAVVEGGGGEAEGFELAEEDLIEHASHGDQQSARVALHDAGAAEEAEPDPSTYGEADHEHADEGDDDR